MVAGLTIAIASATSHDVVGALRKARPETEHGELWIFRAAAIGGSVIAVLLAIVFQKENVAYLVALAMTVSASSNFPVVILSLYWRRFTAAGALAGGIVGLIVSVGLIVVSPGVWVKVLEHPKAIFPSDYPALVSCPLAFLVCWLVSLATQPRTEAAVQGA